MIDEKTRMAIALKRFSLISPVINGQASGITEYSREITKEPIEMPYYGFKSYAPKTIGTWYSDYINGGIDALKPAPRSDRGISRVLKPEMAEGILQKLKEYPKAPATIIYDMLTGEKVFLKKDVSIATVRRFIRENRTAVSEGVPKTQMLRFSKEQVNQLWMTDIMYGPYVGTKKKKATYLFAYIDDASRLITHAGFYLTQDIASLRNSFRDAVLRRGLPVVIYTDNGKIYRSQGFEYMCAGLGVTLLHHAVGLAHQKGKIERFFRTVRLRFISVLKSADLVSIDTLNEKFGVWLLNDYQKRPHEGLSGETPLDFFLKQTEHVRLVTDLAEFNRKMLITVKRTVKKDATISFIHLSLLLLISSFHLVVFLCDFFLPLALSFVILYPSFLTFFLTSFVAKIYYSFLLTPFLNFTYSFLISKFSEFVLFCSPYLYISFPSYILLYSILLTSLPLHHSSVRLHVTSKQRLVSIF